MKTITIHFVGVCKPRRISYGSFEIKGDTAPIRESKFKWKGWRKKWAVEYLTLIRALKVLTGQDDYSPGETALEIYSNSKSLVEQLNGRLGVNSDGMLFLLEVCQELLHPYDRRRIIWNSRKVNP